MILTVVTSGITLASVLGFSKYIKSKVQKLYADLVVYLETRFQQAEKNIISALKAGEQDVKAAATAVENKL